MEGIINLENIFEGEDSQDDDQIFDYSKEGINLKLKTRKMHIGVSRSVWKASIVMAHYLKEEWLKGEEG